jgi:hypothetical protein
VRLHPVKDGLIPEPHERGLTVRDRGGNRLVDLISPDTGFCTGVTSPLTMSGESVFPGTPTSGGRAANQPDVLFSPEERVYYEPLQTPTGGRVGIVVRTCADSDGPLRTSRIRIMTDEKSVSPGKKRSVRKENDSAARAILSAMGWTGPLTPEWREMALRLLAREKALQAYQDETSD